MSSYFLVLHTLCDAPHPSKHEIIDDIRIESGRTQPVCVYTRLLTYCVVYKPKNLRFTCKPIDYCSHLTNFVYRSYF